MQVKNLGVRAPESTADPAGSVAATDHLGWDCAKRRAPPARKIPRESRPSAGAVREGGRGPARTCGLGLPTAVCLTRKSVFGGRLFLWSDPVKSVKDSQHPT